MEPKHRWLHVKGHISALIVTLLGRLGAPGDFYSVDPSCKLWGADMTNSSSSEDVFSMFDSSDVLSAVHDRVVRNLWSRAATQHLGERLKQGVDMCLVYVASLLS